MKSTVVLVVIMMVDVLNGKQWQSYDFPDPQQDYEACGLSAPAWLCDPANILSTEDVASLSAEIEEIHTSLGGCDSNVCTQCRFTMFPGGKYLPAVAIVPAIVGTNSSDDEKLHATQAFADFLRIWQWDYGSSCGNDLVITLAVQEGKVFTSVGEAVVAAGLTVNCSAEVGDESRKHFTDANYGEGLLKMMQSFRTVLGGDKCDSRSGPSERSFPYYWTLFFANLLFILLCWGYMFCKIYKCWDRCRCGRTRT